MHWCKIRIDFNRYASELVFDLEYRFSMVSLSILKLLRLLMDLPEHWGQTDDTFWPHEIECLVRMAWVL